MAQSSSCLHVEHLSKEVVSGDSKIVILRDVNLDVANGETVAILGASGSGKTTLLTLLAGLDSATGGTIVLKDHNLSQLNEEARARLRSKCVGFVFQSFQLLPTLTALENVMLPLEIQYVSHQRAKKRALNWLDQVGLKARIKHYPTQLSGGEQQRVAIARAFVTEPEIIFADEMTGNLDTITGEKMSDILFSLNKGAQTTLLLVTHDNQLAKKCQRRLSLHNGVLQPC